MARLYRVILTLAMVLSPALGFAAWESGKNHTYTFSALTGGGSGALDSLSGASVGALDRAIVQSGVTFYFYENLDTGVTAGVESSPYRIVPDDLQAGGTGATGTSTWALTAISGDTITARALVIDATRWDDGAGGLDNTLVRAGVTPTVFDKSTDELGQIISGTSDQFLAHNGTNWVVVDPSSSREALGVVIGTDVQAWDADLDDLADGTLSKSKVEDSGNWDTAYGWGDHSVEGYLSGDTEAGTPTGIWDFTGGTINFTATDMEADLEAVLDIEDLQSGTSRVFDKSTDTIINIDGTAWRVIYTDASGDVTELALGASGEYLKSQGAAAAPTWGAPSGSAVTTWNKAGTVLYYADDRVYIGDAYASGVSQLEVEGGVSAYGVTVGRIVNLLSQGYTFGDQDTGFYEISDDNLALAIAGGNKVIYTTASLRHAGGGWSILFESPSATNPVYSWEGDADTGMGKPTANQNMLISGGVGVLRTTTGGVTVHGRLDADSGASIAVNNDTPFTISHEETGLTEFQVDNNGVWSKNPTADNHVATKAYVDTEVAGAGGGGGGGSGATTIQASDGTEAEADTIGDAPGGFFVDGRQGIETVASGNTVTVLADNVHSQVTAYITAQDFLTEETDSTALSELTDHTAANTTTGVSIFDGDYDADILIYDTDAGTWSAQSVDGDATIDDTGTLSIANGAVSDDEIDYGTVTVEDFTNDAGYLTTATDLSAPSGVTEQSAVTAFKCWTILSPDEMISGATEVPIWTVNESQFPRGIMLVSVSAEVTSGTTGYTIVYEEWTDSHQNDIESITCTNGAQTEVERGNIDHRVIEANRRIYLDVPSTKAYSVHGCFGYYPR